jgi:hypothetical protein
LKKQGEVKEKEERTSFCEQKEAKKLYLFQSRLDSAPREAEQKSFLVTCVPMTERSEV